MHVRSGAESPRYAIVAGSGFYLIAAAFLGFASRRLKADWERSAWVYVRQRTDVRLVRV